MNVIPRRYYDDKLRAEMIDKGTVVLECEAVSPPSSKGKKVRVFFSPEDVTKALLVMRDAARKARM